MGIAVLTLAINAWAVVEHYLSVKNALELLGTERLPLYKDELLGQLIGAFVPNATLPLAIALTVATVEAIGLYVLFHELFEVLALNRHRRQALRAGDEDEAAEALHRIIMGTTVVVIFAVLLVPAIRFDLALFRFRSLAGTMADPTLAAQMPGWASQLRDQGDFFSVQLAQIGAWGYLAFTAIGCLVLERAFSKTGIQVALALQGLDDWWERGRENGDRFEEDGQWVEASEEPDVEQQDPLPDPVEPAPKETAGNARPTDDQPVAGKEPAADGPTLHDVVGGQPGERVTLEQANSDKDRYHVDLATQRVWSRTLWEQIHDGAARSEAA